MSPHIDRYLRRTGMRETTFGRAAVNDPRLVGDLRRGRVPGSSVRARVVAAMKRNGVERTAPEQGA